MGSRTTNPINKFAERGDPVNADFTHADLILNANWHDLDLSGIVPGTAKAVILNLCIMNTVSNDVLIRFRKKGNVNDDVKVPNLQTQVINRLIYGQLVVVCDENQFIQYLGNVAANTTLSITVYGWFT